MVRQELWQLLFAALVFGAAVCSGVAVIRSTLRARGRPQGQKHRDEPIEVLLICVGLLSMVGAFLVGSKALD